MISWRGSSGKGTSPFGYYRKEEKVVMKKNEIKKIISYLWVGAMATIAEWTAFFLFWNQLSLNYLAATAFAFVFSTFVNWLLGRLWTFREEKGSIIKELVLIYCASAAGLVFNMLIMFLLVQKLQIYEMLSKMIATAIVFVYNYAIRRFFIYKRK